MERVLLVNPPGEKDWSGATPFAGLAYIAGSLEGIGCRVKVIDCQTAENWDEEIKENAGHYDTIGISINVATVTKGLFIAETIRKTYPGKRIILGGPHPSAVYDKLIPKYADIVVIGEGEETAAELFQSRDLSRVKGIAYWDNSRIRKNEPRPFIEDLDAISPPAWHLFELKKYRVANLPVPRVPLITSRGCPYNCIFCTKLVHGSKLRVRSVKNVLKEIDYLVERFGVKEIWVSDDNFTFDLERAKEICRGIIRKKYKDLRLALSNGIPADTNDEELFRLLKEAGFYWVCLSVESGDNSVLEGLGKKIDLKKVPRAVNSIHKNKMQATGFFMIGLPGDTVESIQRTIDFAKGLALDQAYFWITVPFPGTRLYNLVEKNGRFLRDLSFNSINYSQGRAAYETDNLKAGHTEKMFRSAYRQFYLRPAQIRRSMAKESESFSNFFRLFKSGCKLLFCGKR